MAFLKKLGNVLEDAASFAVPAAVTLGAGAISGGGLGAVLAGGLKNPSVLSALGAGAGGFKRNEEEERLRKMQLQQNKNQGMANLINQLSSRPNYQAKQAAVPSAGFLEQLAGGAQTGIQAYQTAQAMQQAAEDRALRNKVAKAQLEQLQSSSDAQAGAGRYAMDRLGENRVENAIRDNMGTIRTETVEAPGIFKPGREGKRLRLEGGPGSLDVEEARMGQDQMQRAMGPTSGLNANEARGYVSALDSDAENRTKQILNIENQDLQRQQAESLDRYRRAQERLAELELRADTESSVDLEGPALVASVMDNPRLYADLSSEQKGVVLTRLALGGADKEFLTELTRQDIDGTTLTKFNELVSAERNFANLRKQLKDLGSEYVGLTDGLSTLSRDPEVRKKLNDFDSSLGLVVQNLGKALQGRMTDADLKIIGDLVGSRQTTTYTSLEGKFDAVERFMRVAKGVFAESLEAGNYRVPSGLEGGAVDSSERQKIIQEILDMVGGSAGQGSGIFRSMAPVGVFE